MKIEFIEIQNFRKLKSCHIDLSNKETLFVGANNSGKTSAMDALILFLYEKNKISTTDFTISNWSEINRIGTAWLAITEDDVPNLSIEQWQPYLPSLDIWIAVNPNEVHYVSHLIPTLDWDGGILGVRLRFEPVSIETLYQDFTASFNASQQTIDEAKKKKETLQLKLWPKDLHDFLDEKLRTYFKIEAYTLDPSKYNQGSAVVIQTIPLDSIALESDPLKGLIKIDIINAQRGFSDPNTSNTNDTPKGIGSLSSQFRSYYDSHLNPSDTPDASDIDALDAIDMAKTTFDDKLKTSFHPALTELEELGYPGFGNPKITLSSKVNPIDGLNHASAVQFDVMRDPSSSLRLPEKYNGLGYQNLISMIFQLIRFRNEWMKTGKQGKNNSDHIEPLHLILIEEPEAHLHAQVQQVFINKAYGILRKHDNLEEKEQFSTQLVVSTHSSHIAHEVDFVKLRYFQRKQPLKNTEIPTATVVNLSKTFGGADPTTKFAIRYLKTTHCDLFFADAVILVEGSAERMLIPHFMRYHFPELTTSYISLLEIGGSHADKLRPLIENLGLITLIITDADSINPNDKNKAVVPQRKQGYKTDNSTLKTWIPNKELYDELLDLNKDQKVSSNSQIRVAYQFPIKVTLAGNKTEVIPYTFEDALAYENLELFKKMVGTGLIKKFNEIFSEKTDAQEISEALFEAFRKGDKAKFALELLYLEEPEKFNVPTYIKEGLEWLKEKLHAKQNDLTIIVEEK
jgi:predicted ATP-dependent endonuclease of OLD family